MPVSFNTQWLGGMSGEEVIESSDVTSLYYTMIIGELPNNGNYTSPGQYALENIPRYGMLTVYINGEISDKITAIYDNTFNAGDISPGTISATYAPLSANYFGDNGKAFTKGASIRCPLLNKHITNIMYKLSQIQYVASIPITLWEGKEITTYNYDDHNFINDASIIYSLQTKLNEVSVLLNNIYAFDVGTITVTDPKRYRIDVSDVEEMRNMIKSMQTKLVGVYGNA